MLIIVNFMTRRIDLIPRVVVVKIKFVEVLISWLGVQVAIHSPRGANSVLYRINTNPPPEGTPKPLTE